MTEDFLFNAGSETFEYIPLGYTDTGYSRVEGIDDKGRWYIIEKLDGKEEYKVYPLEHEDDK